ncbi:hypothetical protein QM012_001222 [Aureobasidium pullulans]|uniref:Peptidase M20 domain-containing protein 2 n=1 Tax=Aureobasidium pullulans TaxID=5580 RepID=A0ABR0TG02_AURPU
MSGLIEDDYVVVSAPDPPSIFTAPSSSAPSHLSTISTYIDHLSPELRRLSLLIHDNPELNYKEYKAYVLLVEFFKGLEGWEVEEKACGIDTALIAVFDNTRNKKQDDSGGKVVSFNAEYGGGGKIKLLDAGAYKNHNIAVSLISHPGITPDASLVRTSAFSAFKVEYFGKEAHAAAAPWEGINALDALITAYTAISCLRQQTQPGDIIQGCITQGGVKPNIIHAYAAGDFVVRSSSKERLDALKKRVDACFKGAAMATGAKLKMTPQSMYLDHVPNRALGRSYAKHFVELGGELAAPAVELLTSATQASTDQGNISHAFPSLSPGFWIKSVSEDGKQGGGPHTPDFTRASRTKEAHDKALMVGNALAATAVDVLTKDGYLEEIRKEFECGQGI